MIALFCALFSEAKPLIEKFKLSPIPSWGGFKVFSNEKYILQVSGKGKENAYIGCGYLFGGDGREKISSFINIGLAGHKNLEIGTLALAHKVNHFEKKKASFYPLILFDFEGNTLEVLTKEEVESSYAGNYLFDMEAYFLFQAVSRFLPFELIHSIKIVSDNVYHNSPSVTPKEAERLICKNIEKIEYIAEKLVLLADDLKISRKSDLPPLFDRWHFSKTEQFQLEEILSRLESLLPKKINPSFIESLSYCKSAKEVISFLERFLRSTPIII